MVFSQCVSEELCVANLEDRIIHYLVFVSIWSKVTNDSTNFLRMY